MRNEMNDTDLIADTLAIGINTSLDKLFPADSRSPEFEIYRQGLLQKSRIDLQDSFAAEIGRYQEARKVHPPEGSHSTEDLDLFLALLSELSQDLEFAQSKLDTMLALGRLLGRSNNEMATAARVSPPTVARRITDESVDKVKQVYAAALRRKADLIDQED